MTELAGQVTVLIVDDNSDDREACIRTLSNIASTRYRFEVASDGPSALRAIATHAPDIILLDYFLPGSNGLEVLAHIHELHPFLPVIMLTGQGSEAVAARGIKAGASNYFSKSALNAPASSGLTEISGDPRTLHGAITLALVEHRSRKTPLEPVTEIQALFVDDNSDDREACMRALRRVRGVQYVFSEAIDGPSAFEAIAARTPDVVVLDYALPGQDGIEVLLEMREKYPFLPVIMLTGQGNEAMAVRGVKAGAADYIPKFIVAGEMLHRSIVAAIEQHRYPRTIDLQSRTIQRQREHLEDSNHFLHNLLDHIPDPIFVKDREHRWLMANWAFRELVGVSGRSLADSGRSILPPDAADVFWTQDDRALQSGDGAVGEQSIPDQTGAQRLFSIKRAAFADRTGDRVLVGVMRDITAQRQAEDDFKRQAAQLVSQSQDLANLGAILEESLQEIFLIDSATLSILQVNKGARRNLGYTQQELEHMNVLELAPQFTEQQLRKLLKPLETGEQVETVYHAAYRRKNGSMYEVEVHAQSALSHGRSVFVQIALDETERKRMEHMKSEFISKVSHELRTPLTSIRGALGLVNAGALGHLPEKAAAMVGIANSNAERLSRLVNDILALEKSVSGNLSLEIREVPVLELLRQAIESHAGYAERYKVQFVLEKAPNTAVLADAGRLMQVMANLMSNAAKFSPPGSIVTLRAVEEGGVIRFEIEDRGCGIPDNFRPMIFEKFAQADSSMTRRYDGTGLGLSITKQLVEAMAGQIGFESEVGRGTTFFFELPQPKRSPASSSLRDNSVRVLICEDDPDSALIIRLAIEQAGFETATVATVDEARQKLNDTSFSVMTLDLGLGDADGVDFLEELRAEGSPDSMPIVVVSGRADEARKTFRGDSSSVDWLVKPLNQQLLLQAVRKAALRGECLPRLLYLGSDSGAARELAHSLGDVAHLIAAKDTADCYQEIRSRHFDLLIVEPKMAEGPGKELLDHVKSGAEGLPPLLVLSDSDPDSNGKPGQTMAGIVAERIAAIVSRC